MHQNQAATDVKQDQKMTYKIKDFTKTNVAAATAITPLKVNHKEAWI